MNHHTHTRWDNWRSALKVIAVVLPATLGLSACQFQPLYGTDAGTIASGNQNLSTVSVAPVDDRTAQLVRNQLIFLLSGGSSPVEPTHEVRIRASRLDRVQATRVRNEDTNQLGNTAGGIEVRVSYEIFNRATGEVTHRGSRFATAAYDKTSQSLASERAARDAEMRAAREVAEQLRFAIASDLASG